LHLSLIVIPSFEHICMRGLQSDHISADVSCWLDATVHKMDTHVKFSADIVVRYSNIGSSNTVNRRSLFDEYTCPFEMFMDWCRRAIIQNISYDDCVYGRKDIVDRALQLGGYPGYPRWETIYGEDDVPMSFSENIWYEISVESFTESKVLFSLRLNGHKYEIEGVEIAKEPFYIFSDRLEAGIRFYDSWTAIDEPKRNLNMLLPHSDSLSCIRDELREELSRIDVSSSAQVKSACRSIIPLLEHLLRTNAESRGWSVSGKNLDGLIRDFETGGILDSDTIEELRLVAKPYRDYTTHGRPLTDKVSRVTLVLTLEIITKVGRELDAEG